MKHVKYAYEDLSDDQFELLVVILCQQIFGFGVQGFAKGPDGGRDARFSGTAAQFPSPNSPWVGNTIVQAKHCNGYYRSFSETDFFNPGSQNSLIEKEIPRIQNLRKTGQLDNYILFSNRRLTGNTESEIRKHISKTCSIPEVSIFLCDVEQLELWLKQFPNVAKLAEIDPVDSPLIVSPDALAEVVEAIARQRESISNLIDDPPSPRIPYDVKNKLNNMTEEYAGLLRKRYLKETGEIKAFLSAPDNIELLRMYESVVDEFQLKITAKRKNHQTFDDVMEYIAELLFSRDPVLRQRSHKRITRVILFYMYWNCDIGHNGDVKTN